MARVPNGIIRSTVRAVRDLAVPLGYFSDRKHHLRTTRTPNGTISTSSSPNDPMSSPKGTMNFCNSTIRIPNGYRTSPPGTSGMTISTANDTISDASY